MSLDPIAVRVGQQVHCTPHNGTALSGHIVGVRDSPTGPLIAVQIDDSEMIRMFHPSRVTPSFNEQYLIGDG